jgi:phosphoenolpyruvate synthase/pyruvate phosphate dikinase
MRWTIILHEIDEHQRHVVLGKGVALARMAKGGFRIPPAVCITTEAYQEYVTLVFPRPRC